MTTPTATDTNQRTIKFRIQRLDRPDSQSRWEQFNVPVETGANIISCLQWIAANPVTADGTQSTPVVFDAACLEEICGSCTMRINGTVRQACSCLIDSIAPNDGDTVTLQPMNKFPIVRDLLVNRDRLFNSIKRVRAWVPIDGTYDLGKGPRATPDEQQTRYVLSTCMSCGCCLDACPQFKLEPDESKWDTEFIGAHAINQARLFNMHETGKVLENERMDTLIAHGGINDCGNAQNCVRVCPKEIPLTESIAIIGRAATIHGLKQFFAGP